MRRKDQVELPATLEEVFQPWERAGESRRDCRSHRAGLLAALAYLTLLAAGLSFPCPLFALVGLVLGLATGRMAQRDLDLIRSGHMDHQGASRTAKARSEAHAGLVLSFLALLAWLVLAVCVVLAVVARERPRG